MRDISIFVIALVVCLGVIALSAEKADAQCNIVIEKAEEPDTGRFFTFEAVTFISNSILVFDLSSGDFRNAEFNVDDTMQIRESIPEGYILEIECVEGSSNCGGEFFEPCLSIQPLESGLGVLAECLDDDEGSCTFTNVLDPRNVPTISEYGLIAMAGVLGLIAFFVLRRKKATA